MTFASPFILLALLPWGALAVWLLRGRPPRQAVPFLPLWQGPVAQKPVDRSLRPPPLWVTAALLAALLSIWVAAGPVMRSRAPAVHLTVLLDRGATMSALGERRARYIEAAELLDRELRQRWGGRAEIELVDVITGERRPSDLASWLAVVGSDRRTAVDTSSLIAPAIASELARSPEGAVMALCDHPIGVVDPRLSQLAPQTPWRNIGMTAVTAREQPSPQIMIALRNDGSDLTSAKFEVRTAGQIISHPIALPLRGQTARQFIDVPRLGDTVVVNLEAPDGCDADNHAYLLRDSPPPRLEIRSPLPEAVRRIVGLYTRANPSPPSAEAVGLVNRPSDLLPGDSGAIIETPVAATPLTGNPKVVTHPITAVVDWSKVAGSASATPPPTAREWTPLVTLAGHALVSIRESPARQVWVGFDSPQLAREPDFVIFWTNVFNWLRIADAGGDPFTSRPVTPLAAGWTRHEPPPSDVEPNAWPGLYMHSDGRRVAANALGLRPAATQPTALASMPMQFVAGTSLAPSLILAALACLLVSAAAWRRTSRRPQTLPPALRPSTSLID